jgi:PGAP1-like protein
VRAEEVTAAGDLAADAFGGLAARIHEVHAGIAERVFGLLGASAAPVRVAHDGIAGLAYGATGVIGRSVLRAGARAAGVTRPPDAPGLETHPNGRFAVGALNGAFGDTLVKRNSPLALTMSVRTHGRAVTLNRDQLAEAFPHATPRIAVFVHGLCETEDAWKRHSDRSAPYGRRLETELGYTPVYVRFNSGRHISANGREFARLLADLHRAWPCEIAEIALIGHSMGGLIARSACHYGAGSEAISAVRHVFALGAPHRGAQLERLAHATGAALHRLPETRAIATGLRIRSVGIRDLYHGYLVDEDWAEFDPDAFLVNAAREIPFLSTASHYFVAATVSREPDAPIGRAIGDLLVSRPSAWAQRRKTERLRFPLDHYRSYGGANHFDLLNHPAIGDQLVRWLLGRPALPAPAAA